MLREKQTSEQQEKEKEKERKKETGNRVPQHGEVRGKYLFSSVLHIWVFGSFQSSIGY